jgi:hypothetical protein
MLRLILLALVSISIAITSQAQIGIKMPKDSLRKQQWFTKPSGDTARTANSMPVVKPDTVTKRKMPVAKPSGYIQYK